MKKPAILETDDDSGALQMTHQEIFNAIREYAESEFTHPDIVARVYSGVRKIDAEFFKWAEKKREKERSAK